MTSIFYFVFLFASSMFYPIDPLPRAFRVIALANPITWHVDVMRFATIGVGDPRQIALEAAGFVPVHAGVVRRRARRLEAAGIVATATDHDGERRDSLRPQRIFLYKEHSAGSACFAFDRLACRIAAPATDHDEGNAETAEIAEKFLSNPR